MKGLKIFSVLVAAALLLTPASALARTNFSFSLNLFDCLQPLIAPVPVFVAPPPPPVYYCPPPCPVPYYQQRTYVREYHHHHYYNACPQEQAQPINPRGPCYPCNPYYR